MEAAGRDSSYAAAQAGDIHWRTAEQAAAPTIAQLAMAIIAPTLHCASRGQRAGMVKTCRNGRNAAAQTRDILRRRAEVSAMLAVAKLAGLIVAPAHHAARAGECAGVILTD